MPTFHKEPSQDFQITSKKEDIPNIPGSSLDPFHSCLVVFQSNASPTAITNTNVLFYCSHFHGFRISHPGDHNKMNISDLHWFGGDEDY